MRGIYTIIIRFECCPRRIQRLRRPGEIARDERDLSLGDGTPCASQRLFRSESAGRTFEESLSPNEIAKLRHSNASQRKGWRIVA